MAKRSSKAGKSGQEVVRRGEDVPGVTDNPATNLLMADVMMRAGSYVLRSFVERSMLKGRYDKKTARDIVKNQPASQKLASYAIAKIATKSLPGAALVTGGILARTLYQRGKARRKARQEGDTRLLEQAED